jgi:hypothetical protein
MPIVRNRFIPEIESSGRAKKCLDVLLWGSNWPARSRADLDEIEVLREYLRSIRPSFCEIRLLVPDSHGETLAMLQNLSVTHVTVQAKPASGETVAALGQGEMAHAADTARSYDADALVVAAPTWLPFAPDLDDTGLFLTDTSFFKHYCEVFVRGHDVPWSFTTKLWGQTWNGFYHTAELESLKVGLEFLYAAQQAKRSREAQETGRSLMHNRLPNICFTRDRLLFYDIQKMAARRAKWRRQEFAFETSYYLNFYYPALFGGFDHTALLVSQCLELGLPERQVGAAYPAFLSVLQAKQPTIHAIFTNPTHVEFMKRIAYLRHYASHRGALAPGRLIEPPENELSDADMDDLLAFTPAGDMRENLRQMLRSNLRMRYYEQHGRVVEGVVPIMIDGKAGLIRPTLDTTWNFERFLAFVNAVLAATQAVL